MRSHALAAAFLIAISWSEPGKSPSSYCGRVCITRLYARSVINIRLSSQLKYESDRNAVERERGVR